MKRLFNIVVLAMLFALIFTAVKTPATTPAHAAGNMPKQEALPVKGLLNADGTLDLSSGYSGPLDVGNYGVRLDPLRGPVFSPLMTYNAWGSVGVGSGPNNIVYAIAINGSSVYIGGQFTDVNSITNTNHIAKWNGISWSALGSGISNGQVNALAFNGSVLYVGGTFVNAGGNPNADYIAQWDGSSWSALGDGVNNTVNAIGVSGLDIYIAGNFTNAGVDINADYIAKLDGGTWAALGATPLTGPVNTIVVAGASVYAGGDFVDVGENDNIDRIAVWDGVSWSPLGSGLNASVATIALSGGNFYAGGQFTDAGGDLNADKIAKWDGSSWSALGGGLSSFVSAIAISGGKVYAGGHFTNAGGDANADYIAFWDGITWSALGATPLNNDVASIAIDGLLVYAGGTFTTAGGVSSANRIAFFQFDGTIPIVTSFTATSPSNSLNIPITAFTASDNVGVTGYKITESSTPPLASAIGWSGSVPSTYTVASSGSYTLYPWVKDASGNVSAVYGSPASVTVDATKPTVDSFSATSPSTSLNIPITAFTASDNVSVTEYKITESATPPTAGAAGWTASAPTTFTVASQGSHTLYPWAKDAAGNVSAVYGSPVSVSVDTTAPAITSFTGPSLSASFDIPITTFTASDVIGVTGYVITESSTAPAVGDSGWSGIVPTTYTVGVDGNYTLYPWAKDAAGNVSSVYGSPASVEVDTTSPGDTTAPSVDTFTTASTSNSLNISITAFTASDDTAVTGYLITQSNTQPASGDSGWSASAPTTYTVAGSGSYTLYPWAKDEAGNVSPVFGSPASVTVTAGTWENVGSAGFAAGEASYTSLAFDNGTPYVAYQDGDNSYKATLMKFDGVDWVTVGSAGFSVGEAYYTSLAFDNGTPYVAYQDRGNSSKATVMKFNGTDWVTVGSAGFSAGEARYLSLVFDNGIPYVAYWDGGNGGKATLMKFDGADWVTVGSAGFSAGEANDTSLAFDNGTPYVAYGDGGIGNRATLMKFDGTDWMTVGSVGFSTGAAIGISLAFDNGTPYVAYGDAALGWKAMVMKFNGADWVAVGSTGFSAGMANYNSLAFDNGTAYVAFRDGGNGDKATVMKFDGTGWVTVGSAGFSAAAVWDTSLVFDNGTAYVAYQDAGNDYKATVMKFVEPTDTTAPSVTSFTASASSTSLDIPITDFTAADDTAVTGYLITESATPPTVGASGWTALAPTIFTVASVGNHTLYPWAKDDAGNISPLFGSPASVDVCLGTATVTNNNDSGAGSLRQAIADVCSTATIDFDSGLSGATIHLASTLDITNPAVSDFKYLTIDGSSLSSQITLSGDTDNNGTGDVRVLHIADNALLNVTLDSLTITEGYSNEGGAILNGGYLTITNSTFSNNTSTGSGGAITNNRPLVITNSAFSGNSSAGIGGGGGGIMNNSSLTVSGSTFSGNTGHVSDSNGGAIYITSNNSATITNSTFSGNSATAGGAILTTGNLTINNSTISGNTATYSNFVSGLHIEGGTTNLSNTIIANSLFGIDCTNNATIGTNTKNLIEDGTCSPALSGDPKLGPLTDNGGPTQTMSLDTGSPAINAGDDATCPVSDQRGAARLQGGHCDLGAYEYDYSQLDVVIGPSQVGSYELAARESRRQSFPGVNDGPVKIISTENIPIIAAERLIYKVNNLNTSFWEMMGLPNNQLDTTYWLPWYNNKDLDTQLRFGNVSGSTATVHVYIGGMEMTGSPFTLAPGASTRQSFVGINNGPVKIESDVPIVAAERVIYKVNNVNTSFSEMMALPNSQLDTTYWLPWYNNNDLDTQLRFANVSGSTATVHVLIGGVEMSGSPFTLAPGESARKSFPSVNNGPVKIESDIPIVAAERVIYKVNNLNTSFSEMMALPNSQLDTTYWLPWYNNNDLDTQLRFGNVSGSTATVHVYIGGMEMAGSPFTLMPGASTRASFSGVNNGPIQIISDVPIVAAERVIYRVNNVNTSFSEMMGLPNSQLDTTYWLPWYNNNDLDTQLRFGVP